MVDILSKIMCYIGLIFLLVLCFFMFLKEIACFLEGHKIGADQKCERCRRKVNVK